MAVIIGSANQKGGIGKTTATNEISTILANKGYRVLEIDGDQQGNLTRLSKVDFESDKTLLEMLNGKCEIKDTIYHTEIDKLDIIPACSSLGGMDKKFPNPQDVLILKKKLMELDDDYDIILIDSCPARDMFLNMCYVACDYFIVPVTTDQDSIEGLMNIIQDIEDYREVNWSEAEILGIIYNEYREIKPPKPLTKKEISALKKKGENVDEFINKQNEYYEEKIKSFNLTKEIFEKFAPNAFLKVVHDVPRAKEVKNLRSSFTALNNIKVYESDAEMKLVKSLKYSTPIKQVKKDYAEIVEEIIKKIS